MNIDGFPDCFDAIFDDDFCCIFRCPFINESVIKVLGRLERVMEFVSAVNSKEYIVIPAVPYIPSSFDAFQCHCRTIDNCFKFEITMAVDVSRIDDHIGFRQLIDPYSINSAGWDEFDNHDKH